MSAHLSPAPRLPTTRAALERATPSLGWTGFLRRILRAVETRRQLAELDDRLLRDLGMNRMEAAAEASRAPWDLAPTLGPGRRG